jgi:hypothetical protein
MIQTMQYISGNSATTGESLITDDYADLGKFNTKPRATKAQGFLKF